MQKKLEEEGKILKNFISTSRIFLLGTILLLCAAFSYREPGYCKMVNRITKIYLKECAKPKRLTLTSYGGAMMHDVEEVFLTFLSFDTLSVAEARVLYVEMMEEYLQRINRHEKIRPYLHNFPFEESNIKLSIGFENSERKITQDGHVALMSIVKDHILYYAAYDPIKEEFYDIYEEPYEEALKQVRESLNSDSSL